MTSRRRLRAGDHLGAAGDGAQLEAPHPPSVDPSSFAPVEVGPSKINFPRAKDKAPRVGGDRDKIPTIIEFVAGAEYLGLPLSLAQRTLLKVIYAMPLDDDERAMFLECTGRTTYTPEVPLAQITVIAGRRSGKDSRIAAPIALYEALYGEFEAQIGEPIVVPIVAQNERGARIAFKYIKAYARRPRLNRWVHDENTADLVVENARRQLLGLSDEPGPEVTIQCFACKAAALRGWSIPAAVMDEVAYFSVEGGLEKDEEVQTSIEGAGIHFARQLIVKISSPAGKRGLLYSDQQQYWGVDGSDVLVWKAPSLTMNPTINTQRITAARRRNPEAARSEYDAEFRADIETFMPRELIEVATVEGRHELAPREGVTYRAAVDPIGGTGTDAFTLAIVHVEQRDGGPVIVQDVMRGWRASKSAALDLGQTVAEIVGMLARYRLVTVTGDAYAGDWPTQKFRDLGVTYLKAERDKAGAFLELQPWVAQGTIELLDDQDLARELGLLEKKTTLRGRKPAIGHPKGGHDDYPNALAHAVAELAASLHTAADVSVAPPRARRPAELDDPDRPRPGELDDADRRAPGNGFWQGGGAGFWRGQAGQGLRRYAGAVLIALACLAVTADEGNSGGAATIAAADMGRV